MATDSQDDYNCPDGQPHNLVSSTYVDSCLRCAYEFVYPSISTARPGTKNAYEIILAEELANGSRELN